MDTKQLSKFDTLKHSQEYDIKENIVVEAFANKYCQYFDCPNFTNLDRNYITKTLLLPHINSRFILQNAHDLYIVYARINDNAVQPQEFHISTFFTDKEISDYQQQVDSCYTNCIPIGFVLMPPINNKSFNINVYSIELFDTFYKKRNFGELVLRKLDKMFPNSVIIPRDIINTCDYWIKQRGFINTNLIELEEEQHIESTDKLYQFLLDTCHIKWPLHFIETLYDT